LRAEPTSSSTLSAEQRDQFDRQGYVVFDPDVPEAIVDGVRRDTEGLYVFEENKPPFEDRGVLFAPNPDRPRISNAWKINANVRALALAPKILAVVEKIHGRSVMPYQTLNFIRGSQQRPHADSMHFQSDPPGFMCGAWVALEDIDMDNGPLVYFPGSHRLPMPNWDEVRREIGFIADPAEYSSGEEFWKVKSRQYEHYCQHLIERDGLRPKYGTIRKGQAILWAANLLHGGFQQEDMSRTRHSQVTHYFFEGCRVYSPMATQGERVFWLHPEWIRDPPPEATKSTIRRTTEATIPVGATVLVASGGDDELLDLDGRSAWHFPQTEDGGHATALPRGAAAIDELERLHAKGAQYIVFPKPEVSILRSAWLDLHNHLENRYRAVLNDGAICVIYALDRS
jgi:ectoine hydroxylase-related dioxygenase (phytanoyl-CoA dioxygenase family)